LLTQSCLALSLGALAACSSDGAASSGEDADATTARHAATIEIVGEADVEAALASHRGEGMLLNFWAIWCEPCVAELPDLVDIAEQYRDRGGRVVGLSFDLMVAGSDPATIEDTMADFANEHAIDIPILIYDHDDYEAINERYTLPGGIPVTLAIDKSGAIVDRHTGKAGRERFDEMMRRALGI
jgi:thiol-disulfide isomerase/thioredoxin